MKKAPIVVDPLAIFRHADTFFSTIDQLHTTSRRDRAAQIMVPIVVLSAFASELFFKCLVCIETGSTVPGHLLMDLFNKLSPDTQRLIEKHWDAISADRAAILDRLDENMGQVNPRDLRSNLAAGSDGFRLLRYLYEGGVDFMFNLSDLPRALRKTILELKPEWLPTRKPVVDNPHPVFVEGKGQPMQYSVAGKAVINNGASAFQWTASWLPNADDGGPDQTKK